MIILFWIGFVAAITSFVFFGDEIIAFAYTIPFLVEIKETFGLTIESLESLLVLSIIVMGPISIAIFSLSKKLNQIEKPEPVVEVAPVAVAQVKKEKAVKTKTETKQKEPVQQSPYYEVGLTGIKLKRQ